MVLCSAGQIREGVDTERERAGVSSRAVRNLRRKLEFFSSLLLLSSVGRGVSLRRLLGGAARSGGRDRTASARQHATRRTFTGTLMSAVSRMSPGFRRRGLLQRGCRVDARPVVLFIVVLIARTNGFAGPGRARVVATVGRYSRSPLVRGRPGWHTSIVCHGCVEQPLFLVAIVVV